MNDNDRFALVLQMNNILDGGIMPTQGSPTYLNYTYLIQLILYPGKYIIFVCLSRILAINGYIFLRQVAAPGGGCSRTQIKL